MAGGAQLRCAGAVGVCLASANPTLRSGQDDGLQRRSPRYKTALYLYNLLSMRFDFSERYPQIGAPHAPTRPRAAVGAATLNFDSTYHQTPQNFS